MKNSISQNVRVRQLSGLTLRSRLRSSSWCVMAVMKDGEVHCVGCIVSSRVPSEKRVFDLLLTWPGFVLESVSRVTVSRKDVYKFGVDYALEVLHA